MDGANYLQWNLPNWITVTLMATVGAVIFTAVIATIQAQRA